MDVNRVRWVGIMVFDLVRFSRVMYQVAIG